MKAGNVKRERRWQQTRKMESGGHKRPYRVGCDSSLYSFPVTRTILLKLIKC
jgi:hypothetical protein